MPGASFFLVSPFAGGFDRPPQFPTGNANSGQRLPVAVHRRKAQFTPLRPQLVAPALPVCGVPLNVCASTSAPWKGENNEPNRIQALGRNSGSCHRICARWFRRRGKHKEQDCTGSGKIAWRKGATSWARGGHLQLAAAVENPSGEAHERIEKPRAHGTANRPRPCRNDRCVMILALPFCPIEQARVADNHV